MAIMTHAKFHFNWLMLTSIFGIWASEPPPRAWRTTEKAGPDRVKNKEFTSLTLRIMNQNNNIITDGPQVTIVLHIKYNPL